MGLCIGRDTVIDILIEYYKNYLPIKLLSQGQTTGEQFSESIQCVLKLALEKTNISKPVNLH